VNGANGNHTVNRLKRETEAGRYDMIVHVGDYAYNMQDDEARVGDQFLRDMEPIAARVPYQTCPGNHEADFLASFGNYKQRFNMPGDSENMFFSYDVGYVHLIAFSTEHYFYITEEPYIGDQFAWLENDLRKAVENRGNIPWIILYGHRPMYCSDINKKRDFTDCTSDTATVREGLEIFGERWYGVEALLWKYGVDMYLSGHEHSYERLWPVYQGKVYNGSNAQPYYNPKAPVHIISGSAGCDEGIEDFGPGGLGPWSAFRSSTYGFARMTVYNSSHLHWEQVLDDTKGTILDEIWVVKDSHPNDWSWSLPPPQLKVKNRK